MKDTFSWQKLFSLISFYLLNLLKAIARSVAALSFSTAFIHSSQVNIHSWIGDKMEKKIESETRE
jgi:hypothetical protein